MLGNDLRLIAQPYSLRIHSTPSRITSHRHNTMNTSSVTSDSPAKRLSALLAFVLVSYGIAALGGLSTASSVTGWYAVIQKPVWTPPDWLFGPVWTVLYGLIAWVGWRFWLSPPSVQRTSALRLFGLQWILNALWSPVFFGAQSYLGGAIIIVGLVISVAALIAAGRKVDALAAWSLTPYLLWVSYASSLNVGIMVLNP